MVSNIFLIFFIRKVESSMSLDHECHDPKPRVCDWHMSLTDEASETQASLKIANHVHTTKGPNLSYPYNI